MTPLSKTLITLALFIVPCISSSQTAYNVVRLKSGGKIVGRILEQEENQSVRIELQSGEVLVIPRENISTIDQEPPPDSSRIKLEGITPPEGTLIPEKYSMATDTLWQIDTRRGIFASGVSLDSIRGGYLFMSGRGSRDSLRIDSIWKMMYRGESHFWLYGAYGALTGTVLGAIIGYTTYEKPAGGCIVCGRDFAAIGVGFFGAVLGFFTGGIAGSLGGIDSIYEFPGDGSSTTEAEIRKLFKR